MVMAGRMKKGATVLVLGLTFKENIADIRNTRVVDIIHELEEYGLNVLVWDPVAEAHEALDEYGIALLDWEQVPPVDAVVDAVAHREVLALDLHRLVAGSSEPLPFMDVKSAFDRAALASSGFSVWRL
jgi:UDP-N-acetyl-D-galactosamine dehydrogenase